MTREEIQTFRAWCKSVVDRYKAVTGEQPTPRNMAQLDSDMQETVMRCGIQARYFNIGDDHDKLVELAYHMSLLDVVKRHG